MDVLHFMSDAWQNRRAELEEQAGKLIDHIHSANHFYAGLDKNIAVPETEQFVATQCRTMREAIMGSVSNTVISMDSYSVCLMVTFSSYCLMTSVRK